MKSTDQEKVGERASE